MAWYNVKDELPVWTDLAGIIIGGLGIIATVITLWKLMKKDKERESEIASLSLIALQLKDMMVLNEKRYIESKTPTISCVFFKQGGRKFMVELSNTNAMGRLTAYKLENLSNTTAIQNQSLILEESGKQFIRFTLDFEAVNSVKIEATLTVDKIYNYAQEVNIILTNDRLEYGLQSIRLLDVE